MEDDILRQIDEEFASSEEVAFWEHKEKEKTTDCDSYHKHHEHHHGKKRHGEDGTKFKDHHRWYGYDQKYLDFVTYMHEENEHILKKTIHRVFCKESGKPKLLFKTEEKAGHFIQFNHDEIEREHGQAPVRSYYCMSCGGWHVTSSMDIYFRQHLSKTEFALLKDEENKIEHHEHGQNPSKKDKKQLEEMMTELKEKEQKARQENNKHEFMSFFLARFNMHMTELEHAIEEKNLEKSRAIHRRWSFWLTEFRIDHEHLVKLTHRLDNFQKEIDKLAEEVETPEMTENKAYWTIQEAFNDQYYAFHHAMKENRLDDCRKIIETVNEALVRFPLDEHYVKGIRHKVKAMERRLSELDDSSTSSKPPAN